jgi:hypothetical protein
MDKQEADRQMELFLKTGSKKAVGRECYRQGRIGATGWHKLGSPKEKNVLSWEE